MLTTYFELTITMYSSIIICLKSFEVVKEFVKIYSATCFQISEAVDEGGKHAD